MQFTTSVKITRELIDHSAIPWERLKQMSVDDLYKSIGRELQKHTTVTEEDVDHLRATELKVEFHLYKPETINHILSKLKLLNRDTPRLGDDLKEIYQLLKFSI